MDGYTTHLNPAADEDLDNTIEEEFISKLDGDTNQFVGYLSNYEVYKHMKDIKESGQAIPIEWKMARHPDSQIPKPNSHLPTLIYEALQYFSTTPCTTQSKEVIYEFVKKLEPFKLTKPEKLCILNTRPSKPLDIQAIVEESEERLTEEQVDEILNIVEEILPPPAPQQQPSTGASTSRTAAGTPPPVLPQNPLPATAGSNSPDKKPST